MSGFIAMQREALDHHLIGDPERFRAWFWLVAHAVWKPAKIRIKGETITLERGELSYSVRFMAEAWGWSKSRVARFLDDLRVEGMIETRSKIGTTAGHKAGQGQSIITVCNYDKFQDPVQRKRDNSETKTGTRAGQQRDKEEQGNKGTRKKKEVSKTRARRAHPFPCPLGVDPVDWEGFMAARDRQRAPQTEAAYRAITKKLDEWRDEGWPPGPIVACAAESGWRTLYPTPEMKDVRNGKTRQQPSNRNTANLVRLKIAGQGG